ncbi:hypothetical protein LOTGIDRAFT_144411, partial [Lottia gigantea]
FQYLLLKELNETRVCNSLLVGMGEEDNLWGDKRTSSNRSMVESTGNIIISYVSSSVLFH